MMGRSLTASREKTARLWKADSCSIVHGPLQSLGNLGSVRLLYGSIGSAALKPNV